MKVDSKELARAVSIARQYTRASGMEVTKLALLRADGENLWVRTTTGEQNALLCVNGFDGGEGLAVVSASDLSAVALDTGRMVNIIFGKRLKFEHEDGPKIAIDTMSTPEEDFPVWIEGDVIATLPKELLVAACQFPGQFDKVGGFMIKAAVHLIPQDGKIAVVGTDGDIGMMAMIEGQIERSISIHAELLARALGAVDGLVTIGLRETVITIGGAATKNKISFPAVECPPVDNLPSMFSFTVTDRQVRVLGENLSGLVPWLSAMVAINDQAQVVIGDDGNLKVYGRGTSLEDLLLPHTGEMRKSSFACRFLLRFLRSIIPAERFDATFVVHETGQTQCWYFADESRRYFAVCSAFDPGTLQVSENGV